MNKRKESAFETKKRISESASRLFAQKDFSAVSINEIVQGCGLTKGAFYHYFDSKNDCLSYLHSNFVNYAYNRFKEISVLNEGADLLLKKMMTEMFFQIRDYRTEVTALLETGRLISPEVSDTIEVKKSEIRKLFELTITRGQNEGTFGINHDPHLMALSIYGMCIWAYNWFDPSRTHSAEDMGESFANLVIKGLELR